ncbi:hypothetical protein GSI_15664 [Ganoderma sinense ZZ0214-1]|uniref:F-box domain-containing protein n=1 Tax=Ganoderma sinense ZZ0214-1 TaxID=1077348 RepID=A0A2G8RN79_9APHY|nr:hypothetical protein GSI_15664 [Ganoderma sinense ZZ0214-1]
MAIRPTSQRMDMRSRLAPGQYESEPQPSLLPLLPPSPPPLLLRDPDPMQYPFRLSSVNNMSPIHALPVELLTRIFQLGVDSESIPDDRDHSALTFEVSISHVCRHWRQVALHTPLLWTTVHFRTKAHMFRGNVYLARNARLPIDIYVDTCSEDANAHRKDLLFRDEFIPVFNIVLPHIDRWRELHLKVADLDCKLSARRVLSTCGSAPALRTLQLWHVQNWQTPERLFTAIGPPPVVVFAGELPALKHIVLQGVNLPWMSSPFLRNLTSIEYALHSDDVRMPFHLWRKMLASSPSLERLSLHYSGPRARTSGAPTPDGIEWWGADPPGPGDPTPGAHGAGYQAPPAADPVFLPRLQEIKLIDLEADYLVAVFKSIDAPNVRRLHLELETEDQDFSPFVDFIAKEPSPSTLAPPPHPHLHVHLNGHGHGHFHDHDHDHDLEADEGEGGYAHGTANGHGHGHGHGYVPPYPPPPLPKGAAGAAGPRFPRLETLSVSALVCGAESWRALLESARALVRLEVDFVPPMHEGAFGVLFGTVRAERRRTRTVRSGTGADGRGRGRGGSGSDTPGGPLPSGGAGEGDREEGGVKMEGRKTWRGAGAGEPRRDKGKGKGRARAADLDVNEEREGEREYEEVPILPSLKQLRCGGVSSRDIARLATFRRAFRRSSSSASASSSASTPASASAYGAGTGAGAGTTNGSEGGGEGGGACEFRIRRWEAEESFRDEDGLAFERELEGISARAEAAARGEQGRAREPWRWDEPLEKVVWYSVEGDYDEDEDDEEDESGSGDEDGMGDEDEDGDGEDD